MGADFPDGCQGLAGQRQQILMDGDMDFAGNLVSAGMDQFQIPDKSAGKRILDRDDHGIDIRRIVGREHLFETVEALQFQRDILVECSCRFLVETASPPQNRRFFHIRCIKWGHPLPDSPT